MPVVPMASNMAPPDTGKQRLETSRSEPSADVRLREAFARALRLAGGAEWLAAALDERPSYASKIYDALEGREGRQIHLRWLAPVLAEPAAARELLTVLCELARFQPPVEDRAVTREAYLAALAEVADADAGIARQAMRERVARKLGVRVEELP